MWWTFFLSILLITIFALLLYSLFSLVVATLAGAPYVPAKSDRIKTLIQFVQPQPSMRIADLGSGDGRVVRALAQSGATVHGYEIQTLLVWWSRTLSRIKNLHNTVFYRQNLFTAKIHQYDVIVLYALPHMMSELRQKFITELPHNAKVVSIAFPIPGLEEEVSHNKVYVYKISNTAKSAIAHPNHAIK